MIDTATSSLPGAIRNVEELEELLSRPSQAAIRALGQIDGDILVLGAAGKMGPTLARMALRASDVAGVRRRVWGVSRFSSVKARVIGHYTAGKGAFRRVSCRATCSRQRDPKILAEDVEMKRTWSFVIGLAALLAGGLAPGSEEKVVLPVQRTDAAILQQLRKSRWAPDKVWKWYKDIGPIRGFNYVPRTAVNTTEMWQEETFDPRTIDEELGWAERCGLNSARVFVQYIVYEADPHGLIRHMERFLEIAEKHHVSAMFILFDDCFIPEPKLGKQPDPVPGVHNSQWTASPGNRRKQPGNWPALEKYVKHVVGHFAKDKRIVAWDLYNEAAAPSRPLVEASFAWARAAQPSQPLTSCWQALDLSDVISFHDYGPPNAGQLDRWIAERPALCTECIARGAGSRFDNVLPAFAKRGIGWYMWGLVKGRIQTYYPWGSPKGAPEPRLWHHDLLQPNGAPYRPEEIEQIGRFRTEFNSGSEKTPSCPALTHVRFYPRKGFAQRMLKGRFSGSNAGKTTDFQTPN